jgi:hypothetical protein
MGLPAEKLGPYPFRGLHDFPERADYGHAARAQNVDFSSGRMCRRDGSWSTNCVRDMASVPVPIGRFEFCDQFRDKGSSIFVMVARWAAAPGQMQIIVDNACKDTDYLGVAQNPIYSFPWITADNRRVTSCRWNETVPGKLLLWFPSNLWISGEYNYPSSYILEVSASYPYVQRHAPSGTESQDKDTGPFRTSAQHVPGEWGVVHKGRLFVGGQDGKLRYSAIADLYLWSLANEINEFDGEPLTGGASFNGGLFVFTRNSLFLVDLEAQGSYKVSRVLSHTGCVHHNTICQAARNLLWLGDEGLMGMGSDGQPVEISRDIRRTIQKHAADFPNATVLHYAAKHQIWILLPTSRQIFVYHLPTGNWSTYDWDGDVKIQPDAMGLMNFAGIDRPVIGAKHHNGGTHINQGWVTAMEQGPWVDARDWVCGTTAHIRASWLSLPIMTLGHHQPRIFRHWRIIGADRGQMTSGEIGGTLVWPSVLYERGRAFWLFEGQDMPALLYATGQWKGLTFQSPKFATADRWTDGVWGTHWWNTVGEYWPHAADMKDYPERISLTGGGPARWIQLGIVTTVYGAQFALQSFELDTRRFEGRR